MDLATSVRRQHGVITARQARGAGLSFRGIRGRVARGEWERLASGLYRVTDRDVTPESRVWAAMLAAGDGAVLSGASAGWWWELVPELPATITVTVPRDRSPRGLAGVRIVRRDIPRRLDVVGRHRVDVLDIPLAVLETAVELGGEDGGRVLDRALLRRVALDDVRQAYWRAMGRRGAADMSRLVVLASDRAASELERRAIRLVRDDGLGGEVNAPLTLDGLRVVVDLLFRDARVVVELKGWAFHRDPGTLQADADRENALQLAGYTVISLTWWDVTLRPQQSLARIRAALGMGVLAA